MSADPCKCWVPGCPLPSLLVMSHGLCASHASELARHSSTCKYWLGKHGYCDCKWGRKLDATKGFCGGDGMSA